jgi:hypothetical protein
VGLHGGDGVSPGFGQGESREGMVVPDLEDYAVLFSDLLKEAASTQIEKEEKKGWKEHATQEASEKQHGLFVHRLPMSSHLFLLAVDILSKRQARIVPKSLDRFQKLLSLWANGQFWV